MIDAGRVEGAPRTPLHSVAYRHVAPRYDPRSGEGARMRGGRYNPPDSFPVLYLCSTRDCSIAELRRAGERLAFGLQGLLPRILYRYDVDLSQALDLRVESVLQEIGVERADLVRDDWSVTQQIGVAARIAGVQALLTPSATRVDSVLALFPELVGAGRVEPEVAEHWENVRDLG